MQENINNQRAIAKTDSVCLMPSNASLFQLPKLKEDIFKDAYIKSNTVLGLVHKEDRIKYANILNAALKLDIISGSYINDAFSNHANGSTTEQQLFIESIIKCNTNLDNRFLSEIKHIAAYFSDDGDTIELYAGDLVSMQWDSDGLSNSERWIIQSALSIISRFVYPVVTDVDMRNYLYGIFEECITNDGLIPDLSDISDIFHDTNELFEFLADNETDYDHIASIIHYGELDVCDAIRCIHQFQVLEKDSNDFFEYQKINKLEMVYREPFDVSILDRHINILNIHNNPLSVSLNQMLKELKSSNHFKSFDLLHNENTDCIDIGNATFFTENRYPQVRQLFYNMRWNDFQESGEEMASYIHCNDNELERLNTFKNAFDVLQKHSIKEP